MPNTFDVIDGLVRLLPQFARFASFSVGKRDDAGPAAILRHHSDNARSSPDKVRRVRANHKQVTALIHKTLTPFVINKARWLDRLILKACIVSAFHATVVLDRILPQPLVDSLPR